MQFLDFPKMFIKLIKYIKVNYSVMYKYLLGHKKFP